MMRVFKKCMEDRSSIIGPIIPYTQKCYLKPPMNYK